MMHRCVCNRQPTLTLDCKSDNNSFVCNRYTLTQTVVMVKVQALAR